MTTQSKPIAHVTDFVTARRLPDIGAEQNRQTLERHLVENKGYRKADIEVDVPIAVTVKGERYASKVDLVVSVEGRRLMAIKCAAGSLDSREREIVAAARLLEDSPLPWAAVSDGRTAIVWATRTGRKLGQGLGMIAPRDVLARSAPEPDPPPLTARQHQKESLIFRSYDSMNINIARRPSEAQ